MPELYSWLPPLLSWAATYLAHSTLLIAGLWLVLKFFPRADHAVRESLWKTALVGGVLSSGLQVVCDPPLSNVLIVDFLPRVTVVGNSTPSSQSIPREMRRNRLIPNHEIAEEARVASALPRGGGPEDALYIVEFVENGMVDVSWQPTFLSEAPPSRSRLFDSISDSSAESGDRAALRTPIALISIAAGLVLSVAGIGRAWWQSRVLRQRLAACVPVTGGLAYQLLAELRSRTPHCGEVELLTSDEISEPAAFGVWKWSIILPERAERELAVDELRSLLAHELAHLVRGDTVWLAISRFACTFLAFQPLNQIARREWQKSAEFLSDAWAVCHTGTPLALARCLTEVAGWRHSAASWTTSLAATGRRSGLVDRVERLLQDRSPAKRREELAPSRKILLACGALLGALTLAAPRLSIESPEVVAADSTPRFAPIIVPEAAEFVDRISTELQSAADSGPFRHEFPGRRHFAGAPLHLSWPIDDDNVGLLIAIENELRAREIESRSISPLISHARIDESLRLRIGRIESVSATLFQTRRNGFRLIRMEQFVEGPAEIRLRNL